MRARGGRERLYRNQFYRNVPVWGSNFVLFYFSSKQELEKNGGENKIVPFFCYSVSGFIITWRCRCWPYRWVRTTPLTLVGFGSELWLFSAALLLIFRECYHSLFSEFLKYPLKFFFLLHKSLEEGETERLPSVPHIESHGILLAFCTKIYREIYKSSTYSLDFISMAAPNIFFVFIFCKLLLL